MKLYMLLEHKGSEIAVLEDDSFLFERLFFPLSYLLLQLCKQRMGTCGMTLKNKCSFTANPELENIQLGI